MTSTEFTIGFDGSRNSSKVLKPPGGGSSDIFGTGNSQSASNECQRNKEAASSNTQSRLFGGADNGFSTPSRKQNTSNIFASGPVQSAKSVKKAYVRRNPITGEEYEMYPENGKKENGEQENGVDKEEHGVDKDEQDSNGEQNGVATTEEEKKTEIPPVSTAKPITTSIRVRNPPGGKSSGIF